jgi:[glutamine synthetase] adenylyltransferase / [glutamine synthetase]-adenylyl-L-tyrosine phosphorylase
MSFDKHITLTPEALQPIGIQDTAMALKNLELVRTRLGDEFYFEILPLMLSDLSVAADPDMALNNFERFVSALGDTGPLASLCRARRDILQSLITIFGASRFLSSYLITTAHEGLSFFANPAHLLHPPDKSELTERLASMVTDMHDDKQYYHALRMFRKQGMLRIALRDLLGKADLQEIVRELTNLAEVCLQNAYARADDSLKKRYGRPMVESPEGLNSCAGFAVIAMGKLGGQELNFSSDVDLMYVYSKDGETEGGRSADGACTNRIANHQYFVKLAEKMSAAINEKTDDGFVFRVDLRLRPEGQRGPLAQSLGGYEIYYESWGQTWERSALIKARPVAGDDAVGAEFLNRIAPFVYRKYLDYGAISEIREMKQKINDEVKQKGRTYRDVKLGYGGIREIEFVIQALQLIYAGRDRSLREKNALKALHMLSQKGFITYQEHADLSKAYIFLRTTEHRLQMLDDLQTQTMPVDAGELRTLARRTGYLDRGREAESLLKDYTEHTRKVRSIYDELFAFSGETSAPEEPFKEYNILLDPETSEQEAVALLARYGFRNPVKACWNLRLLREGPAFVLQTPRNRKLFNDIFPPLFQEIIASPDPDMAVNHLESFLETQGSWETIQSFVKLDISTMKVFIAIFANSEYFSRMIVGKPQYLQSLMESRTALGTGTRALFVRDLGHFLDTAPDIAAKLDALRRFKHQSEIRIGVADLLSNMEIATVSRDLSKLAEVCLDAALKLAVSETNKRFGLSGSFSGLAVIGVGKLGSRELTYGSDLDILFVFSEEHASPSAGGLTVFEYFHKISEKTISYLSTLTREGFAFRVDTRLRPTGSKGPLVQSVDAFKHYYTSHAETWERQALLRSRFTAGDRAVGTAFMTALQSLIFQDVDRASLAHDIISMRTRMEEELGKEGSTHYNIKQGQGGLVDIEFLVQYLQLLHGKQHLRIRVPGTYNGLRALKQEKLLDQDAYRMLLSAYLFMRKLESRMRIVSNQSTSDLSRNLEELHPLARRMGFADSETSAGEKLLNEYQSLSSKVRHIFNALLHQS